MMANKTFYLTFVVILVCTFNISIAEKPTKNNLSSGNPPETSSASEVVPSSSPPSFSLAPTLIHSAFPSTLASGIPSSILPSPTKPTSQPTTSQEPTQFLTDPWNFIVLADWHGAESFALNPVFSSPTTDSKYVESLRVLNHIQATYGGDLVILPGDTNTGKWNKEEIRKKLQKNFDLEVLTLRDAVLLAGKNCYGTIRQLFQEAGYDTALMCIGDHELGGKCLT